MCPRAISSSPNLHSSLPTQTTPAPVSTEADLRQQEALRRIVDKASECVHARGQRSSCSRIINISAPSPFANIRTIAGTPETTAYLLGRGSTPPGSTWRALGQPPNGLPRLDHGRDPRDGSVHSLRTLPPRRPDQAEVEESQYGTIASYQTAFEHSDADEPSTPTRSARSPARALWDPDAVPEGLQVSEADDQFVRRPSPPRLIGQMTDAVSELERAVAPR